MRQYSAAASTCPCRPDISVTLLVPAPGDRVLHRSAPVALAVHQACRGTAEGHTTCVIANDNTQAKTADEANVTDVVVVVNA